MVYNLISLYLKDAIVEKMLNNKSVSFFDDLLDFKRIN